MTTTVKEVAKRALDELPEDEAAVVLCFIGYLHWRQEEMDNLADLAAQGKVNTKPLEGRVTTLEMLTDHSESGKLNLVYGER